ncbi:MAG: hypothetical protein JO069_02675 [Verrucomicrobia bacterium]|nr:hypothetical protein [Verrucomicrobiota bacterium]
MFKREVRTRLKRLLRVVVDQGAIRKPPVMPTLEVVRRYCRELQKRFFDACQEMRESRAFKPVAAALLTLLTFLVLGPLLNQRARVVTKVPGSVALEATPPATGVGRSAREAAPTSSPATGAITAPKPEPNPSSGATPSAFAEGRQFAEELFAAGLLFSELNAKTWSKTYPAVYRKVSSNRQYAAKFTEGARAGQDELVKATLGEAPLINGANGPVLSAQVSGPVSRAIKRGLNDPASYRHDDARDYSRPRPCYHRNQWCWKVDRFWYRSRNAFGNYVKDCVAAIVTKDDPYHEYRVVALEESKF